MSAIKNINSDKIIVYLLSLMAFSIPFGMWQDQILHGMTMAKIIVPVAGIIFITSLLSKEKQHVVLYWPWLAYGAFYHTNDVHITQRRPRGTFSPPVIHRLWSTNGSSAPRHYRNR